MTRSIAPLLVLLLTSSLALADPAPEVARAAEHFDRGVAHLDAHEYRDALREFQRAQGLAPHPVALFNIGQIHVALGEPVEAVGALQKYLEATRNDEKEAGRRELATGLLDAELGKTALLVLQVEPAGAALELDGRAVTAGSARVTAGAHRLRATLRGYASEERDVLLDPRTEHEIRLALRRVPRFAAVLPAARQRRAPARVTSPPDRTWAYIAGGSALAFAGLGVGLYAVNVGRRDKRERESAALARDWPMGTASELPALERRQRENDDLDASIRTLDGVTVGAFVASAALAGAAAWLWSAAKPRARMTGLIVSPHEGKYAWRAAF